MATSSTALARFRGSRLARALAPVAVSAVVLTGIGVAAVSSTATAAPTATIAQVEDQILALQQDAADAAELWNGARDKQAQIAVKISSLKTRIIAAEKAYGLVVGSVDAMARAAYTTGGIDPSLQALLADDPQAFLDQTADLDQVARSQSTSLRRTELARLALAQLKLQLSQQQVAAAAAATDARAQKQKVDDKLAAAQALLSSLKADERARLDALIASRKAASVKAAHDAANRAAVEAKRAQQAAQQVSHTGHGRGASGGGSSTSSDNGNGGGSGSGGSSGSASSRARAAVAYALSKVGHSYVAGADGPGTFDCSGLTLAAYRSAGVSLPHYSYAQYGVTRHISRSELRPGDLLFYFGGSAHHVSIYIGGGMMVSASNPRDGVEIIAAFGPWYGDRYSGAGRVV